MKNISKDAASCVESIKKGSAEVNLNSKHISDADVGAIAEAIRSCSSIQELYLNNNQIANAGARALGEALKVNGSLQVLELKNNQITDPGTIALGEALKQNKALRSLDLDNQIAEGGIMAIGEALKINNTLHEFGFDYYKITDAGAIALSEALKINSFLQSLVLSNNVITNAGAIALGEALRSNTSLEYLNLRGNKISDIGATALGEALKVNKTLQFLGLGENKITDEGLSGLGKSLAFNSSLHTLYLGGNKGISDKSANVLKGVLRSSRVSNLGAGDPFRGTSVSENVKDDLKLVIAEADRKRIEAEEAETAKVKSTAKFSAAGNSLKDALSFGALQVFEQALMSGDSLPLNRGKIMMTGPGRAGKSATVRSLLNKPFNPNLESTIGADASQTCSVDRSENVVNWREKEKTSEFAEHAARAVVGRLKRGADSPQKPRRMSVLQRLTDVSSKILPSPPSFSSAAATSATTSESASSVTKTSIEIEFAIPEEAVSLMDDQITVKKYNDQVVSKVLSSKNGEETKIALSIWDLGGQEVFYTLHHLFLTKYAVYLCIFDMRQMISDNEKDQVLSMNFTNFWLRSIQMHAPGAPVFLIGTFKDMVPTPEQHEKIDERLHDGLNFKTFASTLILNRENKLSFWPVDNTKSGSDPVIMRLREVIMDRVANAESTSLRVPLAWTLILDKLMATKKNSITMREVIAISSQNSITKKTHVTSMLALFHELGMILHFSKTEELRDVIVLDPQWLVNVLTMIIRNFDLHPYDPDLRADLRLDFSVDFKRLKEEAIVSVNLMNRLWRSEDDNSEIDFTRRKFLVSLMETMTLSCPWRFEEGYSSLDKKNDLMRQISSPTQYLVPSNIRLFRSPEIESKLRQTIDSHISIGWVTQQAKSDDLGCFIVDLSLSFLPIGFFDRLVCLLVAHSSTVFTNSRHPVVANGAVLLSFGMNEFRVDENISQSHIFVTVHSDSDRKLALAIIESMVAKLKDEVMGAELKYRILVAVWREGETKPSLVDIRVAREASREKTPKIWDIDQFKIQTEDVISLWDMEGSSTLTDEIQKISQIMPEGKTNHIYFAFSPDVTPLETVHIFETELTVYGVKIALPTASMQEGIDSAMCVVLLLVDKMFENENIQAALRYVRDAAVTKKVRIPVILVQEEDGDATGIIDKAPSDIREMFANSGTPLMLKRRYAHERIAFIRRLHAKIQDVCSRGETAGSYLVFLSHFKKEAGVVARLMHGDLERRFVARQDENQMLLKGAKAFLDSDDLTDLKSLLDEVRESKALVVLLTKRYFTRPWCLAEIYTALEAGIPIVTVNIQDGGYDRVADAKFLSTLTVETLDQTREGNEPLPSEELGKLGISVEVLGAKLVEAIPQIIEVYFNPNGTVNQLVAGIDDVIDRVLRSYPRKRSTA